MKPLLYALAFMTLLVTIVLGSAQIAFLVEDTIHPMLGTVAFASSLGSSFAAIVSLIPRPCAPPVSDDNNQP